MRAHVSALVLASIALTACGPNYDCGAFVYSPSEERCVCPPGFMENEEFTSCVPVDAGVLPDAGAPDASGTSDSGVEPDTGPPVVPECTTSIDCGSTGLVQCVAQRCVFCAAPSSAPEELRTGADLRPHLALAVRHRAAEPAIGAVGTMGELASVESLVYAFELDSPERRFAENLDSVVRDVCADPAAVATSVAFVTPELDSMHLQVLAEGPTGARLTYLRWPGTHVGELVSAAYTCRPAASSPPRDILPSATIVSNIDPDAVNAYVGVHREREPDGDIALVPTDTGYANEETSYGRELGAIPFPSEASVRMSAVGHYAYFSYPAGSSIVMWSPTSGAGASRIDTPGRTGDASIALVASGSPERYLAAYPIGDRVRLVNVECDSFCRAIGESADLLVDATAVERVSLGMIEGLPVLLSAESLADGSRRLVLRVLRDNRTPFDAPVGGREIVIDTAPAGRAFDDSLLAVLPGTTSRYVVAWMRSNGDASSVRVQSFTATCAP